MSIIIKNVSVSNKTYAGQEILAGEQYTLQESDVIPFRTDDTLLADIAAGEAVVNNGIEDIATISAQLNLLLGLDVTPRDSDGSTIVRTKTTRTGWHYEPRSLDFITSKAGSLYNRKHDGTTIDAGTDYGDCVLKFYDTAGTLLTQGQNESNNDFQTRLNANCCKTIVEWHPQYELEIIGATVSVLNPPTGTERGYVWVIVAPDVPANLGGQVPFLAGGWNLRFFTLDQSTFLDGRGIKYFPVDNVYGSNKFQVVCKHEVGAKIELQFVAEHFKE